MRHRAEAGYTPTTAAPSLMPLAGATLTVPSVAPGDPQSPRTTTLARPPVRRRSADEDGDDGYAAQVPEIEAVFGLVHELDLSVGTPRPVLREASRAMDDRPVAELHGIAPRERHVAAAQGAGLPGHDPDE